MKKLIPILALALLATATLVFVVLDFEVNRQIARLKTRATVLESRGTVLEAEMDAVQVVAAAAVAKASAAQVTTSAVEIVTTAFTPAFVGQALIATVSNLVWIAGDATTNGWIQLSN